MEITCASLKKQFSERSNHAVLYIVGANIFNNEVLANFLASTTDLECRCMQFHDLSMIYKEGANRRALLFMDCASMGKPKACEMSPTKEILQNHRFKVVCYNVDPYANLENTALKKGVRGLIYNHLSIDLYPRAAQSVLDGQLWYPRSILRDRFLSTDSQSAAEKVGASILTRREKEILGMLGSGIKNQDIANKLYISPHTVKTHAYNIYKKINVANRFQAAQWLARNG
ncbi:MAG: response regulator transcription factor [Desulfobacteraceae bacterium]